MFLMMYTFKDNNDLEIMQSAFLRQKKVRYLYYIYFEVDASEITITHYNIT